MDCVFIELDQFQFKKVDHFKYLGTVVSEKNDITKKEATRIQGGDKYFYELAKLLVQNNYKER